jgi:single-strand DNA-binding protein
MNNISISGHLGQNPEIRTTSSGKKYASISIGVKRDYKLASEEKPGVDWFQATLWDRNADYAEGYLVKGCLVGITGSMEARTVDKDGSRTTYWSINVKNIEGLKWPADSQEAQPQRDSRPQQGQRQEQRQEQRPSQPARQERSQAPAQQSLSGQDAYDPFSDD